VVFNALVMTSLLKRYYCYCYYCYYCYYCCYCYYCYCYCIAVRLGNKSYSS